MKTADAMIKEFREAIDRQHNAALQALELLERYIAKDPTKIGSNVNGTAVSARGIKQGSQRDRIAKVLTTFKPVATIVKETGLPAPAVRGCLYARDFRMKVEKKKIKKKLCFIMREEA